MNVKCGNAEIPYVYWEHIRIGCAIKERKLNLQDKKKLLIFGQRMYVDLSCVCATVVYDINFTLQ